MRESAKKGSSRAQQKFYNSQFSKIKIDQFKQKIAPEDLLYFGGSCFAENLYTYWQDHFLPSALSPFGSTYNPLSLKESLNLLCNEKEVKEDELFYHNNLWSHSLFNTSLSRPDKEDLLSLINRKLCRHRKLIKEASVLVLTLGTAFVYEDISKGKIVNNCHRRPSSDFKRYMLSPEDVAAALGELSRSIRAINPSVKIILSLSPVRHLRDNAAENSLSKAVLRCGIDEYLKAGKEEKAPSFYFPSYEILLDELRDYRWYAEDLSHPSQEALSYIMERFCETAGDKSLLTYMDEAESLKNLLEHKLRFPESPDGLSFMEKKKQKLREFQKKYPISILPI